MKSQAFVRAAAAVLSTALFASGAAFAQASQTRTDTAPPPAEDRNSLGAVLMMDEPVLAQRAEMQQMMARSAPDTRSMGAGPARVLQREAAKEELKEQRTIDALEFHRRGAGALIEK